MKGTAMDKQSIEKSVVYFPRERGAGQGVLTECGIVTAAHVVPYRERKGRNIGRDVEFTTHTGERFRAAPLFHERTTDLCVLGPPAKGKEDYLDYCCSTERMPIPIASGVGGDNLKAHILARKLDDPLRETNHVLDVMAGYARSKPDEIITEKELRQVVSREHDRCYVPNYEWVDAMYSVASGKPFCQFTTEQQIIGGTSGGPVVDENGHLIGIAIEAGTLDDGKHICIAAIISNCLPMWLLE